LAQDFTRELAFQSNINPLIAAGFGIGIEFSKFSSSHMKKLLLAGRFKIDSTLGRGNFSDIFFGTDIYSKQTVAVKVESVHSPMPVMMYESSVFRCLSGGGSIPKVHWCGVSGPYNILVIEFVGPTIRQWMILDEFEPELLLIFAKKLLDGIEYVHSKKFVFRDVKLENFTFGADLNVKHGFRLHIIDFGLAKKYTYPNTNRHIAMIRKTGFKGHSPFASHRARQGFEQSRRDDLEAIGNMMMFLQYRELPMSFRLTNINPDAGRFASPDVWLSQVPIAYVRYMKYTQSLQFEEAPNYNFAWGLLRSAIMEANQFNFVIDWTVHTITKENDKQVEIQQPGTKDQHDPED